MVVVAGLVTTIGLILGLNLVVLKVAIAVSGPLTVQGLSALVAGVTMFALARLAGQGGGLRRDQLPAAVAVGLSLTVGSSLGVAFGVQRLDAGVAAILISTTPIMTLALGWFLLKERHSWHGLVGVLCGFVGVGVVASAVMDGSANQAAGIVFMLGGALCWSVGLLLMKRLAGGISKATFIAWQALIGAPVLLTVALLLEGLSAEWSLLFVLAVLYAGAFAKGTSFFLQLTVVRLGSPVHASTTAFLMPVFGTAAGVILLAEAVRVEQVLGALVIFAGIAMVIRSQTEPDEVVVPTA